MKTASLWSCTIALLVVSGCQTNQTVSVHPDDMSPTPKPSDGAPVAVPPEGASAASPDVASTPTKSTQPVPSPTTKVPPKMSPAEIAKQKMRETAEAAVNNISVAKPGSDSWTKATVSVAEFAKRVDAAIAGLKGVAGGFEMDLRNAELQGTQSGRFLIEDSTIYRIDFVDVDHPTGIQRYQADGKLRTLRMGGGKLTGVPVTTKGGPVGSSNTGSFYRFFSKAAFETLAEGRPTWAPLLSLFQKQGFSQSLEIKQMESGGVMRPYYRLLMSKKGVGLNAFEARFDGIRLVPLTMKMQATDSKQRPITAEWRGEWHFNQSVKEAILNPKSLSAPKSP